MVFLVFGIWLLMCGRLTGEVLLTGAVLTALIMLFSRKCLGFTYRHERHLLRNVPKIAAYLAILFRDVIQANLQVAQLIWNPMKPIRPTLITFRDTLRSEWAHTVLSASITLTPGTIAAEGDGGLFTVHCLHSDLLEGLQEGELMGILRKLDELSEEGQEPDTEELPKERITAR